MTVTGVVKEFRWTNPHSWLFVTSDDGRETAWEIELGPINMLSRQGWTRSTFKPGDRVAVEIHPAHGGRPVGRLIGLKQLGEGNQAQLADFAASTIKRVPRPEPVPMSDAVARDFNGMWLNANGGIHFDTAVSRESQAPPLKPEYMARWRQRSTDAAAGRSTTDPTAQCLPAGFPRFLSMVFPGEILQAPHQLNWYAEWSEATLRIYLDGRSPPANLQPSYYGYTTGRWEGTTSCHANHRLARRHARRYHRNSAQRPTDRHDAVQKAHSGLLRGGRDARRSRGVRAPVVNREAFCAGSCGLLRSGVRVFRGKPLSHRR